MKKRLLAVLLLLALLLTACDIESMLTTTSGLDEQRLDITPDSFWPVRDAPTLYYDAILPVAEEIAWPALMKEGYFTVCKDGGWGLIRADGTELLPCLAKCPVISDGDHFMWLADMRDAVVREPLNAPLDGKEYGVCQGEHGMTEIHFLYVLNDEDGGLRCSRNSEGMLTLGEIRPEMPQLYGQWLPARTAWVRFPEEDVPWYDAEYVSNYQFWNAETGESLPGEYAAAGWFGDQPLAPVQPVEDGAWAYIDTAGRQVTEAVYAPLFSGELVFSPERENGTFSAPRQAFSLQNGYAVVRRMDEENGWGLLNIYGEEVIPTENAGCAWEGTTLWRRLSSNGPWYCYLLA